MRLFFFQVKCFVILGREGVGPKNNNNNKKERCSFSFCALRLINGPVKKKKEKKKKKREAKEEETKGKEQGSKSERARGILKIPTRR